MKKSLFILLICALLSVFALTSCNVDASDGLADQVRNSAQASGIRILQLLDATATQMVIRSDKGIYTITGSTLTANKLSNDMKAAYYDGTNVYYLTQAGKLYKYTLSTSSASEAVGTDTFSYLDENGFLLGTDKHVYRIEGGSVVAKDSTHSFSSLLTSSSSYLGKVSGENKYVYNGTEFDSSLTFTAIVDTGSNVLAAASDKKVYSSADSFASSIATLGSAATGVACLYTVGTENYAVFKASSSFEYLVASESYGTTHSLTTNWASSLRSLALAGCDTDGTTLYVASIGNGIWKVTGIADTEAEQIFY